MAERRAAQFQVNTSSLTYQFPLELIGGTGRAPEKNPRPRRGRGIARCESPIEHQLCLALAEAPGFRWRVPTDHPWHVGRWEDLELLLLAQPDCGPYRPDFAIARADWLYPEPLPVLVEVDGYQYHSGKEQAERDRTRDRFLTSQGAAVLHFSGGEVWRDAGRCASEILALVSRRNLR